MTERHGDRGRDLAQDVQRRHDEDRLEEALEVALDAAVLDLIERDQHERDDRPAERGVQVCRGGAHPEQAGQRTEQRAHHQRHNVRRESLTAFTHRAFDQTVDHQHRLFGQCLLAFWDLLHAVC